MDFSNFEYHNDKVPSGYKEKDKYFENLVPIIIDEIKKSDVAAEFFSNYDPGTLDSFIQTYAERKSFLAKNYSYYLNIKPKRELKFREMAETVLNAIKQKKLFNLQLQWRAEKINIPEIRFCYEFEFWGEHIEACPFLPPVTKAEINLIKEFLKQDDAWEEITDYLDRSQDYNSLTEKNEEGLMDEMSSWYEFYDLHLGTGSLLLLPDIRGEKENFYEQLSREEQRKKAEEEKALNPPKPYIPPPPGLYWYSDDFFKFSRLFETDKHFRELFDIYQEEKERDATSEIEDGLLEEAIGALQDATETVIMPGGLPWKQAIIKCGRMYEIEMTCRELDALFQEMCMLEELGISHGGGREDVSEKYEKDFIIKMYKDRILEGRTLNGEPADFNF